MTKISLEKAQQIHSNMLYPLMVSNDSTRLSFIGLIKQIYIHIDLKESKQLSLPNTFARYCLQFTPQNGVNNLTKIGALLLTQRYNNEYNKQ